MVEFRGTISMGELARLQLDPLDRALMREVEEDPNATPADYLLVLEMLFRRHAEHEIEDAEKEG